MTADTLRACLAATDPVDLLPQPDGTWTGRFPLPPYDHHAELRLEPTETNP